MGIPFSGCDATTLCYPLDVLFMMVSYAGILLPRFQIITSSEDVEAMASKVTAPIRIQAVTPFMGYSGCVVTDPSEVARAVEQSIGTVGKLLVSESRCGAGRREASVLATAECPYPWRVASWERTRRCCRRAWMPAPLCEHVLYGKGYALLQFVEDEPGVLVLDHFVLNPDLSQLVPKVPHLPELLLKDALVSARAPCFCVALHSDSRKGYHLCAAHTIKKDDIVFDDECRSFAVVTKPYVDKNWDVDMKKTFSEYAWPLDSEGHLYAIWEKDPRRWRPINHSCDPNCIFDSPYSLNVIASRDIARGEDLSMDYATFCDVTMKPFECLCGAPTCRGTIRPNDGAIRQYGTHSWIRQKGNSETKELLQS
ncbi:SET domain protein [Strigomonas culicis]|uniref:SET domain protein n=1 Tax=Strigomonas culicis TaxID=28005 RepID=S9U8K9_9TRYP|nr:SET domain protein [Strigomonas culicis]|eukprot:EPY27067.1 SET domain protein [Strigomonas culicis]